MKIFYPRKEKVLVPPIGQQKQPTEELTKTMTTGNEKLGKTTLKKKYLIKDVTELTKTYLISLGQNQ